MQSEIEELKNRITKDIEEGLEKYKIPGIAIGIVDKEGLLWSEGFGYTDNSKKTEVTTDTLFMIGSLSKAYTVTAFLRAMQKGKIYLDDPLRKHYPEFTMNTRFGEDELDKITFRHMLTHWAGFQHNTFLAKPNQEKYYSFEEYVKEISNSWQKYPVGNRISYSNAGFDLVAYVLQKISGKTFATYMKEEVYQPLGMSNSQVNPVDALKTNNVAIGYRGDTETPYEDLLVPYLGAGSQYSSVNDMSKYLKMHFNNGYSNGQKFLEEKYLEEMYKIPFAEENQLSTIGMGIGVGLNKYGGEMLLRFFGDGPGYFCLHLFFPKLGIGCLILTNQVGSFQFMRSIVEKVEPSLVKFKMGKIPENIDVGKKIKLPVPIEFEESKLKRLAGLYISRMLDVPVKYIDGKLIMSFRGIEMPLTPHSNTIFSSDKMKIVKFELDEKNRPITVKLVDNSGKIDYLDYDSGPADEVGLDKEEWKQYSDIYRYYCSDFCFYSTTEVRNGHLHLISSLNNKIYKLSEYKPGVFFIADGQSVIIKKEKLIMPMFQLDKDEEISIEKIKKLLQENPKHKQAHKTSMQELLFIYEQTNQKEKAKELKELIEKTYPEQK